MTTMMKRILAVLRSLVMLFSAMPFAAAAEEITAEPATPTDLGGAEDQIEEAKQEAVNDLSDQIISLTKEDCSVKKIDQEKEKDELIQLINVQNPAPASMKLMARSAPPVSYHGSETSYLAMKEYLGTEHELPTAFFADSDEIALGAMKALQEAGYRVPEQISVTGFGDIPFAQIASPELSSVHVSQKELGQMAVQYLFHAQKDTRPVHSRILLPSTLVARSSVRELTEA